MALKNWVAGLLRSIWFKIAIAALVVILLIVFNRVDWAALSRLGDTWPWLLGALLLMLPPYAIVSYRFKLILQSQGIQVPLVQAIQWSMIGSFFDLAMPSSNGGDIVKAGYVVKHVGAGMRTRAVMAVLIDRVLGLLGLFLLASIVSLLGWNVIRGIPSPEILVISLFGASFGVLLVFRVLGSRKLFNHPGLQRRLDSSSWGLRGRQLIASFNELREHPRYLLASLALSVFNHIFWCIALLFIARAVGNNVDWIKGFVVFPLAIFSNIFGVAGGFGIGTAAFDLFLSHLLSISNGALVGLLFQGLSAISRLAGLPYYLRAARTYSFPPSDDGVVNQIGKA